LAELECPRCAVRIQLGQDFCGKCGLALKGKRSGFPMKLLKGAGLALLSVYAVVKLTSFAAPPTSANAEQPPEQPAHEVIDALATELASGYEANSVAADSKFKDRRLRVTGKITAISTDIMDHAVIAFDGRANQFMQPQATLVDAAKPRAAALRVGEMVMLICIGAGDIAKTPMLRDCTFSN